MSDNILEELGISTQNVEIKEEKVEEKTDIVNNSPISVQINLNDIISVPFTVNTTGKNASANTENKSIRLLYGRTYYIPIIGEIDSDFYKNMKILSQLADKIDVRYIKNKMCCIIPIQNNVILKHEQTVCYLWN